MTIFLAFKHINGNPEAEKEVNDVPGGTASREGRRKGNRRNVLIVSLGEIVGQIREGDGRERRRRIWMAQKKRECDVRSPKKWQDVHKRKQKLGVGRSVAKSVISVN